MLKRCCLQIHRTSTVLLKRRKKYLGLLSLGLHTTGSTPSGALRLPCRQYADGTRRWYGSRTPAKGAPLQRLHAGRFVRTRLIQRLHQQLLDCNKPRLATGDFAIHLVSATEQNGDGSAFCASALIKVGDGMTGPRVLQNSEIKIYQSFTSSIQPA